jgi:hypothetical protein
METLLEQHGLALWVEDRVLRLLEDGATTHMARGYTDCVSQAIGESLTTSAWWTSPSPQSTTTKVVSWQPTSWVISE